jgi:hypothetical protein
MLRGSSPDSAPCTAAIVLVVRRDIAPENDSVPAVSVRDVRRLIAPAIPAIDASSDLRNTLVAATVAAQVDIAAARVRFTRTFTDPENACAAPRSF